MTDVTMFSPGIQVSAALLAQQGIGIEETLEAVVKRIPAPQDTASKPLRALIFDSHYDSYKVHCHLTFFHPLNVHAVSSGAVLKTMLSESRSRDSWLSHA